MPLVSQKFYADAMLKEYQVPGSYFGDLAERLPSITIDDSNIVNTARSTSMLRQVSKEGESEDDASAINGDKIQFKRQEMNVIGRSKLNVDDFEWN